ncbi:MAG TPA: copper resistance protein CopC [Stellaceae bacterium]|jgi:methionine-rich copper-binding protein CopC|nr:copper resistance protein CopC [Stellaceae bacterium]
MAKSRGKGEGAAAAQGDLETGYGEAWIALGCIAASVPAMRLDGIGAVDRLAPEVRMPRRPGYGVSAVLAVLVLGSGLAEARPLHVRQSSPAAGAVMKGRHAQYLIRFDGPVDHVSARLELEQSGRVVGTLHARLDSAPDVLFAAAAVPPPGQYVLHWEVRSPEDGEVTSGDIPFSVGS